MRSRKRESISVGTLLAMAGVALGTMALVTVLGVTGGFRSQFRDKVLGVNAHVLVLKYASEFREYRDVMAKVEKDPDVLGASPFVINPMMVTHDKHTATGVLLKGVDPERMLKVLDLPRHMIEPHELVKKTPGGNHDAIGRHLAALRRPGATPPERKKSIVTELVGDDPIAPKDPQKNPGAVEKKQDFLKELEAIVARDEQKKLDAEHNSAAAATASALPSNAPPATSSDLAPLPKDAPSGAIEPADGFASVLPEDDIVDDIIEDPCKQDANEAARAALPGIVIGSTLQKTLGVKLGDCVQVTSPTIGYAYSNGQLRPPVAKQFRVHGIFEAGFDQYDSKLMYTDLYDAQAFYGAGDTVTGVEMRIKDIEASALVTRRVDELLNNGIYHTMDWEELNRGLFTALRIQQILMSQVLALIILVAAFTVIATLIMIVFDKKREIAALKAMGARDSDLLLTFLYQGLLIGVTGTLLGLALGYGLCQWALAYGFPLDPKVYFISRLPIIIRPLDYLFTGLFAIFVCLAACVWPALHAARLRPAEAFREQ
jgi:lipoprotein-releasing system permease protein